MPYFNPLSPPPARALAARSPAAHPAGVCSSIWGCIYVSVCIKEPLFSPYGSGSAPRSLRGVPARPRSTPGTGYPPAHFSPSCFISRALRQFRAPVSSALLYFTRARVHQSLWQLYTLHVNGETRGDISFSKAIESSVTVLIFFTVFFLFALLVISPTGGNERADLVFVLFSHALYLRVAESRMF